MSSSSLVTLLARLFDQTRVLLQNNADFLASSQNTNVTFALVSSDSPSSAILITVHPSPDPPTLTTALPSTAAFTLSARPTDWHHFFTSQPPRSFQSYWGILRVHGHNPGVSVLGSHLLFTQHARLWRLVLDCFHLALHPKPSKPKSILASSHLEADHITGSYLSLALPTSGLCKIFYETSGTGPQSLLLLHTAGADSRQCHALMNNASMRSRCTMVAFDLPNHGRSYPAENLHPGGYALDEEEYVNCIAGVIRGLGMKDVVVSGASMGGQVCLAVAIRAAALGVVGVVALEACEHIPFTQPLYETGVGVDEGVLNAERVCGMIAPMTGEYERKCIWWGYSGQGKGVFSGDLKFYFGGWDGRGRVEAIDTKKCPVVMLTGEWDYSCTSEMSEETSRKMGTALQGERNVMFEEMKGLGHFPMTENPDLFVPYMEKALDWMEEKKKVQKT